MARREQLALNQVQFSDGSANGFNIIGYGTAAPTTGTNKVGDVVMHKTPAAAGNIGWVCTTAGTPGTWKTWGAIAA